MINFRTQIYKLGRNLVPYFLRSSNNLYWQTEAGLIWLTNQFQQWSTGGDDSRHKHWIECLLKPIDWLNSIFADYADKAYYRLAINGQVIYLEHYLNDLFDSVNRGIYISDDNLVIPPYIYNQDHKGLYLYNSGDPIILYNDADFEGQGSFIVNVPGSISLTESLEKRIRAAVNRYRQAGALFTVINS